jgi:hypothetical protein
MSSRKDDLFNKFNSEKEQEDSMINYSNHYPRLPIFKKYNIPIYYNSYATTKHQNPLLKKNSSSFSKYLYNPLLKSKKMSPNNIKDNLSLKMNNNSFFKSNYNGNENNELLNYDSNFKENNCQIKNNVLKNIIQKNKNKDKNIEKGKNYYTKINNHNNKINVIINERIYNNIKKINKKNIRKNKLYENYSILSYEANKIIKDYNNKQVDKEQNMNKRNILINKTFSNINNFNYLPVKYNNSLKNKTNIICNNNKSERSENIFNNYNKDNHSKSIIFSRINTLTENNNNIINFDLNNKRNDFSTNIRYNTIGNK